MGALSGAIYGAAAELTPLARAGYWALFGAALWAIADEIAVPAGAFGIAGQAALEEPCSIFGRTSRVRNRYECGSARGCEISCVDPAMHQLWSNGLLASTDGRNAGQFHM